MNTGKTIYVYFDHRSAQRAPVLLGMLTARQVRFDLPDQNVLTETVPNGFISLRQ